MKPIRIWAKLIKSAYCDVEKLPPHLVEVEIDLDCVPKIKKAFFEMMVPDHKSNRDKERNKMWDDFLRILNQ